MSTPNPGSAAAIASGCLCLVLDSGFGADACDWQFSAACPVHAPQRIFIPAQSAEMKANFIAALNGHRDTAVIVHGGAQGGGKTAAMESMAKSLRGLGLLVVEAPQSDSLRVIETLRAMAQVEPKTCALCRSSRECTGACE